MKFNSKSIFSIVIGIIAITLLLLVLLVTEKLLSIWHYLQEAPLWVSFVYSFVIMSVAGFIAYLYLVFVRTNKTTQEIIKPIDEHSLRENLTTHAHRGVDISEATLELKELDLRRGQDKFYIALYGSVSAGKSSFIKTLLPQQQINTNVLSGTTKGIEVYQYKNLAIVDLPGLDDSSIFNTEIEKSSLEETMRAHVVVFLTDSDFTQTEMQVISKLTETKKPMVIALNKADRYTDDEKSKIINALETKTGKQHPIALISTGGKETVLYKDANGKKHKKVQIRKSNIQPLIDSIEKVVANNPETLHHFRDVSMLMLSQTKLIKAKDNFNRKNAENTIKDYTKKAVFGAMASVAPGSDLVIQGTLATKMIQSLCEIYQVSPKQMEIDQIIRMTGGKLKTSISLVLAVAGNALKSFPGIGTAVGGITHAVSYGMIFNALGNAVLESVSTLGKLDAQATNKKFEENLLGPAQTMAKDLAKMALKIKK